MKCLFCGYSETKVIDSRESAENVSVRRRRECQNCGHRFTTFEAIELKFKVKKKDGELESYSRQKLLDAIKKACGKKVPEDELIEMVERIEQQIYLLGKKEVTSGEIGDTVLKSLKDLDEVCYVRFASLFKAFKGVDDFYQELLRIKNG